MAAAASFLPHCVNSILESCFFFTRLLYHLFCRILSATDFASNHDRSTTFWHLWLLRWPVKMSLLKWGATIVVSLRKNMLVFFHFVFIEFRTKNDHFSWKKKYHVPPFSKSTLPSDPQKIHPLIFKKTTPVVLKIREGWIRRGSEDGIFSA